MSALKVLFIAYYFPPDSSSGSFRPLFFANHLSSMGVDVHVLTARVEDYLEEQTVDEKLLDSLSEKVRVTRTVVRRPREAVLRLRDRVSRKGGERGSINYGSSVPTSPNGDGRSWFQLMKDSITDLLGTPDAQVGWIPNCIQQGREIVVQERPDIIFATGGPWSGMVAAARLAKSTKIPLVLDFRDPWQSNPARAGRAGIFRWLDTLLEKYVVTAAARIVANTEELRGDFLRKYPVLRDDKVVTITNGFEDYLPVIEKSNQSTLTITHTGELYFSRNPANLLQAIKNLIDSSQVKKGEISLQIVGGINIIDTNIAALLQSEALQGTVHLIPRVPYRESIRYNQLADVLLLIQPNFPLQIPRKLFEYLAAQKPLLCISEGLGATAKVVAGNGLGYVCENEVEEIERAICRLVDDWRANDLGSMSRGSFDRFMNKNLTRNLSDVFSVVVSRCQQAEG